MNAIGLVVNYLLDNHLCTPEEETYLSMLRTLLSCTDGSSFGIACQDEVFDPLTAGETAISLLRMSGNTVCRYWERVRFCGGTDEL